MNNAERKISGLSALGVVRKIVNGRAIVEIQNGVFTPPVKWGVLAAGEVNTQRTPSIGEQVVLLNTCGGDDLTGMVIVAYLHSDEYPAPNNEINAISLNAGEYSSHITTAGDKTEIGSNYSSAFDVINEESSKHVITSNNLTINAPIDAKKTLTLSGLFSGVSGVFKSALSVAGIGFKSHTHKENDKGGNTGGAQ